MNIQLGKWRLQISCAKCPEGYFIPGNGVKNKWQAIVLLQTVPKGWNKDAAKGKYNQLDLGSEQTNGEPNFERSEGGRGNDRSAFL